MSPRLLEHRLSISVVAKPVELRGANVIDVHYDRDQIRRAIERSLNDLDYRATLKNIVNLWGDGQTGGRVANILANLEINRRLLEKQITY